MCKWGINDGLGLVTCGVHSRGTVISPGKTVNAFQMAESICQQFFMGAKYVIFSNKEANQFCKHRKQPPKPTVNNNTKSANLAKKTDLGLLGERCLYHVCESLKNEKGRGPGTVPYLVY